MTASVRRRPVTARDFNRLLFALLLLAALTVLARLVTRQESRAESAPESEITLAQWTQTADALFLKGEWLMATDAFYGALETGAATGQMPDLRIQKKLAICLAESGDTRGALHYMRLYRLRLLALERQPSLHDLPPLDSLREPSALQGELASIDALLKTWEAAGS